jgi:hypothetical protein
MSNECRSKQTGKFSSPYAEPVAKGKNINFRVPASLAKRLEEVAGEDLSAWLRQAIAEKLEREQQMSA